jgi:hypothetical protein
MSSKMPQVYIHYFGTESSKSILETKGIIKKNDREKCPILKSTYCPNCTEPNKSESKFCGKCKMILSYDSYTETIEKQMKKESEIQIMKQQIQMLTDSQKEILECLKFSGKINTYH